MRSYQGRAGQRLSGRCRHVAGDVAHLHTACGVVIQDRQIHAVMCVREREVDEPAVVGSQRRGCRLRTSAVSFPVQSSSRARARARGTQGTMELLELTSR